MFSFISEGDDHPPTLMQQLKSELKQKNMLFSKECIKIFTVVGQGIILMMYKSYIVFIAISSGEEMA